MRGKFITFEGCDGVGKSTQIDLLKRYFEENGVDAVFTREPGGTTVAEKIREIILDKSNLGMSDMCELLLYSASRAEHVSSLIKPLLNGGKTVVCDRFIDSTFAYQGCARGMDKNIVNSLNMLSTGGLLPDLTILLDVTPSEATGRKSGRQNSDRLEHEGNEFQDKVYFGYLEASANSPKRFVKILAESDKMTTHSRIIEALKEKKII